jgi:hypothetical protein
MWVVDHLEDLESDLSVFHRIDNLHTLDGPRFFRLALRIFAYDGVMSSRLAALDDTDTAAPGAGPGSVDEALAGPIPEGGRARRADMDVDELAAIAPGLIERTEVNSGG